MNKNQASSKELVTPYLTGGNLRNIYDSSYQKENSINSKNKYIDISFEEFIKDYLKSSIKYSSAVYFSCDRITIIYNAPPKAISNFCEFNENLENLINNKFSYSSKKISKEEANEQCCQINEDDKGFYHFNRKLIFENNETCFVSWGFRQKVKDSDIYDETKNNIRIDFNPNKINLDFLLTFYAFIHPISFLTSRFSRIDIAIDYFFNFDFSLAHDNYIRKGGIWFDKSKGIETLYLGSKQSERQIRFYNKKIELQKKYKINLNTEFIRCECQLRNNWHNSGLKNPFDSLKINKFLKCNDIILSSCIKEIKEIGLMAYLSKFKNKDDRHYFKKKISPYLEDNSAITHPRKIFNECYKNCIADISNEFEQLYRSVKNDEYEMFLNFRRTEKMQEKGLLK